MSKDIKQNPKAKQETSKTTAPKQEKRADFALGKMNYFLILVGMVIVTIGFFLMSGTEDIFSFVKIDLSIIFVIGGFMFIIFAIMKRPKDKTAQ